jgi:RNA polymerase sigma-B factor
MVLMPVPQLYGRAPMERVTQVRQRGHNPSLGGGADMLQDRLQGAPGRTLKSAGATHRGPEPYSDDAELLETIRAHSHESDERQAAFQVLIVRYQWLVRACVRPYRRAPETHEDLMQAGYLVLVKAITYFDPEIGSSLAAYARPSISGEIKRHFRDKRWQVHVTRPVQELRLDMRAATAELTQQLQRRPLDAEVAEFLQVGITDVAQVHLADTALSPASLNASLPGSRDDSGSGLAGLLGAEDPRLEHLLGMEAISAHWSGLPAVQQRVLLLRFYGNMTQADIASRLHVSQMQISRLQARALEYLRTAILEAEGGNARSGVDASSRC